MYSTCLFCNRRFGLNDEFEQIRFGRRLAFDSSKGRLWVICRTCERWNLVPIDKRWEVIELCEQRFRDSKARYSTENIGMARLSSDCDLVRIGRPLRREFAFWRYGDQFGRRRRRYVAAAVTAGGGVGLGAVFGLTAGLPVVSAGFLLATAWPQVHRIASAINDQRLITRVTTKRGRVIDVRRGELRRIRVEKAPEWLPDRPTTGWWLRWEDQFGRYQLEGHDAVTAAYKLLPSMNASGASRAQIDEAVECLEQTPDPLNFLGRLLRHSDSVPLFTLASARRLALEMAVSEQTERVALDQELTMLEEAWRDAEEIAAIADSLLVPKSIIARFRMLRAHRDEGGDMT